MDYAANQSLLNEVTLLRLKSAKSLSGQPTQANSVSDEIQKWSYFEKMERLKRKTLQAHTQARVTAQPDSSKSQTDEVIHLTDGIQVPHPDWQSIRAVLLRKMKDEEADAGTRPGVISLDAYLRKNMW